MLSIAIILLVFVDVLTAQYTCCDNGSELEYDTASNDTMSMICFNPETEYGTNLSIHDTQNCKMHLLHLQNEEYNYTITDGKLEMFENGNKEFDVEMGQYVCFC